MLERVRRAAERSRSISFAPVWKPQPGPQTHAYNSDADVIGYGGAAGGGKSDLLMGFAGTKHRRSIIFRRVFPSLRGLIERSREIFNPAGDTRARDSYNEQLHVWRLHHEVERMLEFGAVQYEQDKKKHQGQPRDLVGFDEVTEIPESVVHFLMAWNRTTTLGQKCRVVMTFNPPMDETGEWVIRFFAPWLDDSYPNPAQDGELRWYAMLDGEEVEMESGEPFERNTEIIIPKSRTFFHASLKDNPILEATGYGATIDALPEPLRSLLKGSFDAAKIENPFQTIPLNWIKLAVGRWRETPPTAAKQTALGVDVARGGRDQTVIAERFGYWVAPLHKHPGHSTPDGNAVAGLVLSAMRGEPVVNMDVIGVGSSPTDLLKDSVRVRPINFGEGTHATDRTGRLKFANVRAAAYWRMRELIDPDNGYGVCLPDDRELIADLAAPKWELRGGRIYIESKEDIRERLGRSTDCGDAVVLAFYGSDPLPAGIMEQVAEPAPSRFVKNAPSGGRWGRNEKRGWRR